ncbi:MAG: hypothetical protein COC05_00645 [Gammaproteobacteria bacterium]|nr:MAG: hypothetical protein COC05_00645 [Gammaproteobacteria bacterium]
MALSETEVERAGALAYENQLRDWVGNNGDAVDNVVSSQPHLKNIGAHFQKAAVLGLGMNATEVLYPDSALVKTGKPLLTKLAIPLHMADLAMQAHQKQYNTDTARLNKILNQETYLQMAAKFKETLGGARDKFVESSLGVTIETTTKKIARQLKDTALTEAILRGKCKKALDAVIDVRHTTATAQIEKGFGSICERAHMVYSAWQHREYSLGSGAFVRLDPMRQRQYITAKKIEAGAFGLPKWSSVSPVLLFNPITGEHSTKGPERSAIDDKDDLNKVLTNIWQLEVALVQKRSYLGIAEFMGMSEHKEWFVWPITDAPTHIPDFSQVNISEVRNVMYSAAGLPVPTTYAA